MDKRSLEHLARRFREAETRTEILRQELAEAIREASADEVPQKDICDATGYTRQQVRRIVKAGEAAVGGEVAGADPDGTAMAPKRAVAIDPPPSRPDGP